MKKLRLWFWRRLLESGNLVVSVSNLKNCCFFILRDEKRRLEIDAGYAFPYFYDGDWLII